MPSSFSIKRPLQLRNVVKFSRNLFSFPTNTNRSRFRPLFLQLFDHRQSVYLSFFSIASEYLFSFFSFSKYFYKSMARIQPSFLHIYLFRPRQHNTSFLLTSKDELKYPGGSFPKQPKPFTLSFTLFQ